MNGLEAEKPQRLLDNALAFYEAGRRCNTPAKASIPPYKDDVELGAPTVACFAFAIELFLKLLLLLETGKYDQEHELDEIFEKLSSGVKEQIESNCRSDVRYYLKQARNAFVQWRYQHEYEFLIASPEDLAEIGVALRATVRELRPDLVSVFEA